MAGEFEGLLELGGAAAVELAASALAERGKAVPACANCGAPVIGEYCAVCGQERNIHRRSVLGLLHELFSEIANFDSRILQTVFALLWRPGELSLAFREGRTRRYLPALRLYLFVSLIFFLVLSMTHIALVQFELAASPINIVTDVKGVSHFVRPGQKVDENTPSLPQWKVMQKGPHYTVASRTHFFARQGIYHSNVPAAARARIQDDMKRAQRATNNERHLSWIGGRAAATLEALTKDPAALNGPITTWIPRVLFLLLPAYALLLALFYIRKRKAFFFVDHLIFSLNIHSFGFVLLLLAAGAAQLLDEDAVFFGTVVLGCIYTWLSMKRFYAQNWIWTSVKFACVSFIYLFFFLIPAFGGIILASVLNV